MHLSLKPVRLLALAVPLLLFAAACGDDSSADSSDSGSKDDSATTVTVPDSVPDGTTLRIGDQNKLLQIPLEASGEIDKVQFKPEWSTFVGGPPLLEAFRANEIDIGFVGDTPPILAAAAGQDLVIVAAWRFDGDNYGIVVGPDSDIESVEDLKGKSLAFQKGTAAQAYAVRALDEVDLSSDDVETIDLSALDVSAAVKSGDADAGVLVEPLLSQYLTTTPGSKKIRDSKGLTTNLSFIITTKATLDDPAKAAAIGDFLARERAAFTWSAANRDALVAKFAEENNVPIELARQVVEGNAGTKLLPLDGPVTDDLQALADDLYAAKVIPKEIDIAEFFDPRFESITTG